jgi:hypothetical protein
VTLVRVNETNSGSDFLILNLQMVTRAEARNFKDEQERHHDTGLFVRLLHKPGNCTAVSAVRGHVGARSVSYRTYPGPPSAARACSSGRTGKNAAVGHKRAKEEQYGPRQPR